MSWRLEQHQALFLACLDSLQLGIHKAMMPRGLELQHQPAKVVKMTAGSFLPDFIKRR